MCSTFVPQITTSHSAWYGAQCDQICFAAHNASKPQQVRRQHACTGVYQCRTAVRSLWQHAQTTQSAAPVS